MQDSLQQPTADESGSTGHKYTTILEGSPADLCRFEMVEVFDQQRLMESHRKLALMRNSVKTLVKGRCVCFPLPSIPAEATVQKEFCRIMLLGVTPGGIL